MLLFRFWLLWKSVLVTAYTNNLYTITKSNNTYSNDLVCMFQKPPSLKLSVLENNEEVPSWDLESVVKNNSFVEDLFVKYQEVKYQFLFGSDFVTDFKEDKSKMNFVDVNNASRLLHYPTGNFLRTRACSLPAGKKLLQPMTSVITDAVLLFRTQIERLVFCVCWLAGSTERDYSWLSVSLSLPLKAELFQNKSGVHLPPSGLIHRGYCLLRITEDYMQTAVDAFAILLDGNIEDIKRLPADYVLRSARTISMMKLTREKFVATWYVVKGSNKTKEVTYETLERYRPLFKYINGKEISRLDLTNDRILTYIGTHPDLDRHQVGVVASAYIQLNRYWSEPRYLNMMNNLLCGVPMTFMRKLPENTYLQLSQQVFYHIRACDPLQRRFYLAMMTRTQVLGKAHSWNAQDVSRLGLLLAEVEGPDLSSIKPEALSGITAQVMLKMRAQNLQYLTEVQLRYIGAKSLNILARKLKTHQEQFPTSDSTSLIVVIVNISWPLSFMLGWKYLK